MRITRVLGLGLCCVCSLLFAKDKAENKKTTRKNNAHQEEVQLLKPMGSSDVKITKAELNAFKQDEKCSNFIRSCEQYSQKIKEFNKRSIDLKKSTNRSADKTLAKNAQRMTKFRNKCIKDANEVLRNIHKEMAVAGGKGDGDKLNSKMTALSARENFIYETLKALEKEDLSIGLDIKYVEPEFGKAKDKNKSGK